MKRIFLPTLLGVLLCPLFLYSQLEELPQRTGLFDYTLSFQGDTVPYLLSSTGRDFTPRKLVLFIQGSMPEPLFTIEEEGGPWRFACPVPYRKYMNEYFFCILPKPGIPIVAKADELTANGLYMNPQTGEFLTYYQERNYLEYYVDRADAVLRELTSKLEFDEIVLIGGSEGARVAASLAHKNELITHLIYYSTEPLGRFYGYIFKERQAVLRGEKTEEEASEQIAAQFKKWEEINKAPLSTAAKTGDTNRAWTSFSVSCVEEILALDIPVIIAHGTADPGIQNIDYLHLEAIRRQKDNITFRAYHQHNHWLNKLTYDEEGKVVSSDYVFDEIYASWLEWVANH